MNARLSASFVRRFLNGPEIRVDDLNAESGVTVLFGASGSGKTTILRCLAGLDTPNEGAIRFDGEVWFEGITKSAVSAQQRRVGFVPQDFALFPHLSVEQNIGYGLKPISRSERRQRVKELTQWLGLEHLTHRLPHELSGGQQQRVALARAVAPRPHLLLLDEPLSALDAPTRQRLRGDLRQWLAELTIPTLLVTHDRTEALTLGQQVVVLDHGTIRQSGTVERVFNAPNSLAVAQIVGTETVVPGRILANDDGLVTVAVENIQLLAVASDLPKATLAVHVCIRAEDVILTRDTEATSSARNRLPARVVSVQSEAPLMRVELNCGFPLKALLTRYSAESLAVSPGASVVAWIKAPQVHLIPR